MSARDERDERDREALALACPHRSCDAGVDVWCGAGELGPWMHEVRHAKAREVRYARDVLREAAQPMTAEQRAPGRPIGGFKSEKGQAAYWRLQWESATSALADLIAEHRELVERIEMLIKATEDRSYTGLIADDLQDALERRPPSTYLTDALEGREP